MPIAFVLAAAVLLTGCTETSSTVTTNPDAVTTPKCQVSLSAPGAMGPDGGSGSVAVTTQPECTWTASSTVNWITGLNPASGQGNGTVAFNVSLNDTAGARDGDIVINDIRARVSQRAPCRYTVTPANQNIDATGGSLSVTIATAAECAWSASSDVPWLSFPSAASGTGNGSVTVSVAGNTGPDRVGTITVNGQRAMIMQTALLAPNCNTTITPSNQNIAAAGGPGTAVTVTAPSTCPWTSVSNVPWISVVTGANGVGNGSVTFTVAANTGAARSGTLTIAGRTFTVNQAGAAAPTCTYAISSGSQDIAAAGGNGSVNVTAGATCGWTAASGVTWIAVTAGASGSGNGTVSYSVQANSGAARSGTISIAGQTFTVNQAAAAPPPPPACTYALSSNSQNVAFGGGTGNVNVTTGSTCAWTATSNAAWITVTAGASGTGNGTVSYLVSPNTGAARSGTITIGGQTFTVNQAALVCSFTVEPNKFDFSPAAGTGTVTVTTSAGCSWTATTGDAWITITAGASGTGSGTVAFSVAANTGRDRKGNLTVAGRNVDINQKGP